MNREEWLHALADRLTPWFVENGLAFPEGTKLSCGLPTRGALPGSKHHVIGECWSLECSAAGHPEIFISPMIHETVRVAATVVHELIHAALPGAAHGPRFAKAARIMLLAGKPTATVATEELETFLAPILKELGDYPHAKLTLVRMQKPQSTRLVKIECPDCGCVARITRKWLDSVGAPICACQLGRADYSPMMEEA